MKRGERHFNVGYAVAFATEEMRMRADGGVEAGVDRVDAQASRASCLHEKFQRVVDWGA